MDLDPAIDRLLSLGRESVAVVAHRGASASHPENTMEAFEAAIELGVDSIEFDARMAGDGVLVCIHDETSGRTARGGRDDRVDTLSSGELECLDVGSWKHDRFAGAGVPTLARALQRMCEAGVVPMVEHKDGAPEAYVDLIRDLGLLRRVLLQSFDWDWLRAVRKLEPEVSLGVLGGEDVRPVLTDRDVEDAVAMDACFAHWRVDRTGAELVHRFGRVGFPVAVYTADTESEFAKVVEAGVSMVTTNEPERLQAWRDCV